MACTIKAPVYKIIIIKTTQKDLANYYFINSFLISIFKKFLY